MAQPIFPRNQYGYEQKGNYERRKVFQEKLLKLECFACGSKVEIIQNQSAFQEFKCMKPNCGYSKGGLILTGEDMI